MDLQSNQRHRPFALLLGLLFGLCTLLAGLSIFQVYVCDVGLTQPPPFGALVRQELKEWYALGFISLGVVWFASRNVLQPGRIKRWSTIHFAASLVFGGFYALFTAWLVAGEPSVMHPGQILTFSYLIRMYWAHYLILYMIVYWLVVFAHLGWHYYQRFRERETQTAQLQHELVEARLDALRMQLNPHFLFNTLHAISSLIHDNPQAADRVVARLSELLRLTLDQTRPQEVPLTEEMAFLDRYLEIEQTRFAERLRVEKHISPETQRALVPYLILQPLVENAVRHGIEPREDLGVLKICAARKNGRLELLIQDNGQGLASKIDLNATNGIGLSNTKSRLRHLYGEDCKFELSSAEGGGLEARVEIPFHTAELTAKQTRP
jgi:two-component sensor histidine kinase